MSGFGIYIHWPFCAAKCPYCDFNSHVRKEIDESGWIDAIVRELEWTAAEQGADRPIVETVFFGGGTPSLMQGKSVGRTLDTISRLWRTANDVEVTLESNPASADAMRFADYRAAGVNRLSLGVQALNDKDLKILGRLHNVGMTGDERDVATRLSEATRERQPNAAGPARHHRHRFEASDGLQRRFGRLRVTRKPEVDEAAEHGRSRIIRTCGRSRR